MEKKILFLDLDGTLLTDSKDITEENLAAIQKATELGHAIVVCTGRPLVSTAKQVEKLGLTAPGCYAITSNGALIYDAHAQETIFYKGVHKDCIREAFDEAYKFHLHPQTYNQAGALCEHDTEEMHYYSASTILPYEVVEDRVEAIHWAMDHAQAGDVIVLCGKGHETYQEVGHEKRHLDEREVVADYIAEHTERA